VIVHVRTSTACAARRAQARARPGTFGGQQPVTMGDRRVGPRLEAPRSRSRRPALPDAGLVPLWPSAAILPHSSCEHGRQQRRHTGQDAGRPGTGAMTDGLPSSCHPHDTPAFPLDARKASNRQAPMRESGTRNPPGFAGSVSAFAMLVGFRPSQECSGERPMR
jgi:hypothetical protein